VSSEGRNVAIEFRWAEDQYDRLPVLVPIEFNVAWRLSSRPAPLAAKAGTSVIPIIFNTGSDPVEFGLVANLDRPGGNHWRDHEGASTFGEAIGFCARLCLMSNPKELATGYSIATSRPSTNPVSMRPCRNSARKGAIAPAVCRSRYPITGIGGRRARAATGHSPAGVSAGRRATGAC
jgi:hypothetical protein